MKEIDVNEIMKKYNLQQGERARGRVSEKGEHNYLTTISVK